MFSPEPQRICPRCGYANLNKASYCFQCGRDLFERSAISGTLGTGSLIAGAFRFIEGRGYTLEPELSARLKESRSKMPPDNLIGEPLTCLQCGTLNETDAVRCVKCNSNLTMPDEDFNLLARVSARTSIGQVRSNNEDSLGLWAIDGVLLALIADGMGGAAAGEIASHLAVETVQADFLGDRRGSKTLSVLSERDLSDRLAEAVTDANHSVMLRAQSDAKLKGMGTTSTLALIRANRLLIAHVGDSRAYHIDGRSGVITQVTKDHSFVQALVASGHITPEQARTHPMGSILYRALGQSPDLEVDVYSHYIYANDRIIMCSDGLTRHLDDIDLVEIVMSDPNPHVATEGLIALANSRGGEDNVSVIVIKIAEASTEDTIVHRPLG
jgi:protein phosphatase